MDARVETAIELMHKSVSDQLSMRILARSVNLSATRLRQLFKQETGRTPMQYLKDLRLQRAKELLQTTFLSIKQVSFFSGIQNANHFMREFKKRCGLTPSQFRTRWRKEHSGVFGVIE